MSQRLRGMHWRSGGIWLDKPFTAVPRRQAVSSHQPKIHLISHQKSRPCLTKAPPTFPQRWLLKLSRCTSGASAATEARVALAMVGSGDLAGSSRDELLEFRKRRPPLGTARTPPTRPLPVGPHPPEPHPPNRPPSQQHHGKHEQSSSCLSSSL